MKKILRLLLPFAAILSVLFAGYAFFGYELYKRGDYEASTPMLVFATIGFAVVLAGVLIILVRYKSAPPVFVQSSQRKIHPNPSLPMQSNLPALYASCLMSDDYFIYQNIMGVYILRWIRSGQAALRFPRKKPKALGSFALRFYAPRENLQGLELELYVMLLSASGQNYRLHEEEFASWLSANESRLRTWHKQIFLEGVRELCEMNFVQMVPVQGRNGRWTKPGTNLALTIASTKEGEEEIKKVQGYAKYLDNGELMSLRHTHDVQQWEDYLAFAHFFNRADKMELTFDDDYPPQFLYPGRFFRFATFQLPYLYMDGSFSFVSPTVPAFFAKKEHE